MTVKELKAHGYVETDSTYQRGYIRRRGYDEDAQQVRTAGGSRKGQYYYLAPAYQTSQYCIRRYMAKA